MTKTFYRNRRVYFLFLIIICSICLAVQAQPTQGNSADLKIRFTSGKSALKIPFKLYNNHIYTRVRVNNSKPLWFLIDTGAGNIINARNAKTIGLKLTPVGQTTGVGESSVDVSLAENISFALPSATYREQKVAVLSLESVEDCANEIAVDLEGQIVLRKQPLKGTERQPIDGVLGDDFFKNFVVEIDYSAQFINLYDPQGYNYSGRGTAIPIELTDNHIYLRALLTASQQKTVNSRLMIDSGSMVALILNRPFVEKNNLLPPKEQTTPFNVCGIGGDSKTQVGNLKNLKLENLNYENPVVMFSQAANGVLAREDFDGSIGNAILRRFKVIFDYSRKQMILESTLKK
jgi:Aspartyl protease